MQKCDICSKSRDAAASGWRTITHRELKDSSRLIAYGLRIKARASPDRMVSLGNGLFFRLEVDDSTAELPSTIRDAYLAEVEGRFGESDWLLCPDCQKIHAGDGSHKSTESARGSSKPHPKTIPEQTMSQTWKERFHQDDDAQREVIEAMEARERAWASTQGTTPEKLPDAPNTLELVAQCCLKDMALFSLAKMQNPGDELVEEFASHSRKLFVAARSDTAEEAKTHLVILRGSQNEVYALCARVLLACIDAAEKDAQQVAAAQKAKKEAPAAPAAAPDRLRFNCPECGKAVNAPLAAAGKKAPCPGCKKLIVLPQPAAADPAKIAVICSCGKRIVGGVELAGKRFKCPQCSAVNRVPTQAERKAVGSSNSGAPQKAAGATRASASPARTAKAQPDDVNGTVRVLYVCTRCKHRWTSRHDPHRAPMNVVCPQCDHKESSLKVIVGGLTALAEGTPEHLLPPD